MLKKVSSFMFQWPFYLFITRKIIKSLQRLKSQMDFSNGQSSTTLCYMILWTELSNVSWRLNPRQQCKNISTGAGWGEVNFLHSTGVGHSQLAKEIPIPRNVTVSNKNWGGECCLPRKPSLGDWLGIGLLVGGGE